MTELGGRHLVPAFGFAVLIHLAFLFGSQWIPERSGAVSDGVGGLSISMGSAGGAPGSTAAVIPDATVEAQPEATAEEIPEAVEQAGPPTESVTFEEPPVAEAEPVEETIAEHVEPETITETVPITEADPVELELVDAEARVEPVIEEAPAEQEIEEQIETAVIENEPVELAVLEETLPVPIDEVLNLQEATVVENVIDESRPQPRPPARPKKVAKAVDPVAEPGEETTEPVEIAEAAGEQASKESPEPIQQAALTAGEAAPLEQDTRGSGKTGAVGQSTNTGDAANKTSGGAPGVKVDYMAQLAAILSRHKRYPRRAQSRRQQGTGELQFVVDENGTVVTYTLHRSSGYSLLDKEIMAILGRVGQFPPIPQDMGVAQVEVIVPVNFNLQ